LKVLRGILGTKIQYTILDADASGSSPDASYLVTSSKKLVMAMVEKVRRFVNYQDSCLVTQDEMRKHKYIAVTH